MKNILKDKWISENNINSFIKKLGLLIEDKCIVIGFSGPGASGKTTALTELNLKYGFHHLLNVTTRKPRVDEQDGVDYWFLSEKDFERTLSMDEFFCTVYKSGRGRYGIYKKDVLNLIYGQPQNTVLIESPLVLSHLFNSISIMDNGKFSFFLLYLLPNAPLISNLIGFLNNRQDNINIEEININHGWRQIEEFSSIISIEDITNIFVLEGFVPMKLARILGEAFCQSNK